MYIKVRLGLFETNSSSSHSIAIRNMSSEYDNGLSVHNGKIHFYEDELSFGRSPFRVLMTVKDKAAFAIASFSYDDDYEHKIEEIENILKEVNPSLKRIIYPTDWYRNDEDAPYYGSIDHQSIGLLQRFLVAHPDITLKEFITNSKYIVFIDGDEYHITDDLFDSRLLCEDDFSEIVGAYKLNKKENN